MTPAEKRKLIEYYAQRLADEVEPAVDRANRRMAGLGAKLRVEVMVDFDPRLAKPGDEP